MAQDPMLTAYWDDNGCGPQGDDHNWAWCKETHFKCDKVVCTDRCPTGQAELVYTRGGGYVGSIKIDDCSYGYFAQYRCADKVSDAEKCHYMDPKNHKVQNPKLTAYWDEGGCGPAGDDHNKDWCHETKGKCRKIACTTECDSGQAELVYSRGTGRMGSVTIDGCSYAFFAQYRCLEEQNENANCWHTDKRFLQVANRRLVAYWDEGNCGPMGDDHNKDWCKDTHGKCKKIACTTECPTGQAEIVYQRGNGYMGSVNIDGCSYAYYAQYHCLDVPKKGKCQYTDPAFLAVKNPRLVAYWDDGNCGPVGDDHNWQWCKETKAKCAKFICTSECPSGQAELVYKRGGNHLGSLTIDGCSYAYFAQYHCSEKSTIPCVTVKSTRREEF